MAEFDEKLNALLSNPDSMAQIMQMAQSLSANLGSGQPSVAPSGPVPAQAPVGPPPPPPAGDAAPAFDLAGLLGSLLGGQSGQQGQGPVSPTPPPPPPPSTGGPDLLSSLGGMLGGMDPKMMLRLLPLVQEFAQGQNTQAAQLLHALRPFLKEERQGKVDRALQLARMIHIGKKFFAGWEV